MTRTLDSASAVVSTSVGKKTPADYWNEWRDARSTEIPLMPLIVTGDCAPLNPVKRSRRPIKERLPFLFRAGRHYCKHTMSRFRRPCTHVARIAQSVERVAFNHNVQGSSPCSGVTSFFLSSILLLRIQKQMIISSASNLDRMKGRQREREREGKRERARARVHMSSPFSSSFSFFCSDVLL